VYTGAQVAFRAREGGGDGGTRVITGRGDCGWHVVGGKGNIKEGKVIAPCLAR